MSVRQLNCPTGSKNGYDKAIQYQTITGSLNSFGGVSRAESNWVDAGRFYGNVKTGSGNEVYRAQKIHSDTTALVTIPWNSRSKDIAAAGRFIINGKAYEILFAIDVDEDQREMQFGCKHVES